MSGIIHRASAAERRSRRRAVLKDLVRPDSLIYKTHRDKKKRKRKHPRSLRFAVTVLPLRRDPGICCRSHSCEKLCSAKVSSGSAQMRLDSREDSGGMWAWLNRSGVRECMCVTHLIGVLRVEFCLDVLFLLGPGCLAALAGDGPPLPLSACTHTSRSQYLTADAAVPTPARGAASDSTVISLAVFFLSPQTRHHKIQF